MHASTESPLELESAVRRTVGVGMQEQLLNIPRWQGFNNPWMAEDDQDVDFSYINLVDNPERYTGYKVHGQSLANRVKTELGNTCIQYQQQQLSI